MEKEAVFVLLSEPFRAIEETVKFKDGRKGVRIRYDANTAECGDLYHSISELYDMRLALTVALVKVIDGLITPLSTRIQCWKSSFHSDGSMFEGYFIVGMTIPQFEGPDHQISWHYKLEHWDKFHVITLPKAPTYDGHTSADVIKRLMEI